MIEAKFPQWLKKIRSFLGFEGYGSVHFNFFKWIIHLEVTKKSHLITYFMQIYEERYIGYFFFTKNLFHKLENAYSVLGTSCVYKQISIKNFEGYRFMLFVANQVFCWFHWASRRHKTPELEMKYLLFIPRETAWTWHICVDSPSSPSYVGVMPTGPHGCHTWGRETAHWGVRHTTWIFL